MSKVHNVVWGGCFLALTFAPGLGAQEGSTEEESSGNHVVRPGDTLEEITLQYLGSAKRWEDNWNKNRKIVEDADWIYPGERLRVLLPDGQVPGAAAIVEGLANDVREKPNPLPWEDAKESDLLLPDDELETKEESSVNLKFPDGSHLVVTEASQVILGREWAQEPEEVDRNLITIELGQADLARDATPTAIDDIEIVISGATVKPRTDAAGALETRARLPGDGGAQLMVYKGESDLEAAGQTVAVGEGMGSSVAEGAPPSPPEELLTAPGELSPNKDTLYYHPPAEFRWEEVQNAVSYTLELCRDDRCGELVKLVAGISGLSWKPDDLPEKADLHWRVRGVSTSGLDGYAGTESFTILGADTDPDPPEVALRATGPHYVPPRGAMILGPGSSIEAEAHDAASGIEHQTATFDGAETTPEDWGGEWSAGEHTASMTAVDRAGNRGESAPLTFIYDPDPPVVSWGRQGSSEQGRAQGMGEGLSEEPSPTVTGRSTATADGRSWELDSDAAHVILKPEQGGASLPGVEGEIGEAQGLWILAEDKICPGVVASLSYAIVRRSTAGDTTQPPGEVELLMVEAVDCVGNTTRVAWRL